MEHNKWENQLCSSLINKIKYIIINKFFRMFLFFIVSAVMILANAVIYGQGVPASIIHKPVEPLNTFELNVSVLYSTPRYELHETYVYLDPLTEVITIDKKRLIDADNLGTSFGFGIEVYGNMRLFKQEFVKLITNIAFVQHESKYRLNDGFTYGVRMYVFSLGAGLQINPIGEHRFYPSFIELLRFNEIGGESYHKAGLDFFVTSPRFGYSTGINLNYKISKKVGISLGTFYNYDNLWNKSTQEGVFNDPHVINFRDEKSPTNGLSHNRRFIYLTIQGGINIYFK